MPFGNWLAQKGPEDRLRKRTLRAPRRTRETETASAGPSPAQVADLRLLPPEPGAAVSRGVERFAEQPVFWPISDDRISERQCLETRSQPFPTCIRHS